MLAGIVFGYFLPKDKLAADLVVDSVLVYEMFRRERMQTQRHMQQHKDGFIMFQFLATLAGYSRSYPRTLLHRITIQAFLLFAAAIPQLLDTQLVSADPPKRPNILLIMSDDMGYSDLGCFGGEIETPNLDRLAYDGLRFTRFYSENMCWVSRASMLTGVYHKTSLYKSAIHPRCVTLPETLNSAGYQTLMSGKWHLAGKGTTVFPNDRGFDHAYGILGGAASFYAPYSLTRDRKNVEHEYKAPDYYFTNAISDNAVDYIENADSNKPLFLYMAYTAAHWPLHAFPKDIARYKGKYAAGWDEVRKTRLTRMKELGVVEKDIALSPRHPNVPAWEDETHQQWQQRRMEVYAAQITVMDEGIGRTIEALKKTGRFENTLILFTIDNGGCHVEYGENRKGSYLPTETRAGGKMIPGNIPGVMPGPENTYQSYGYGWANASNTPYRMFKQFDHEGGIHTPMIAHWPKGILEPGRTVNQVSHLVDIMPTLLDITQLEHPRTIKDRQSIDMDGVSLKSHFSGQKANVPRELYFHHASGRAIREGDWKLVQVTRGKWELYNLKKDPNELINLAAKMPGRVDQLKTKFRSWENLQTKRAKFTP